MTPDYELEERRTVSDPKVVKAMFDPVREVVLDLLLERAATVTELAEALRRPKSTVAHHVGVLFDADLVRVVRTRRVRAIEERFYGRTARLFAVGQIDPSLAASLSNDLVRAANASEPALAADELRAMIRHARISDDDAAAFWERIAEVVNEFSSLPRSGDRTYAFTAGLFPTDAPALPTSTAHTSAPPDKE